MNLWWRSDQQIYKSLCWNMICKIRKILNCVDYYLVCKIDLFGMIEIGWTRPLQKKHHLRICLHISSWRTLRHNGTICYLKNRRLDLISFFKRNEAKSSCGKFTWTSVDCWPTTYVNALGLLSFQLSCYYFVYTSATKSIKRRHKLASRTCICKQKKNHAYNT